VPAFLSLVHLPLVALSRHFFSDFALKFTQICISYVYISESMGVIKELQRWIDGPYASFLLQVTLVEIF